MSDGIEHGTGYAAGAPIAGSAAQAVEASHAVAAASRPAVRPKKRSNGKANGHASSTATADSNSRTIAITLPKDVLEWYDQQAASAPFEPSTQRYVAWQLREWMKAGQKQQEEDRAMIQEAGEQ